MGWQLPIRTSDGHGSARIAEIDTRALGAALSGGEVAVIPGFQGIAMGERVTTLGRGGSDTSARSEEHTSELQSLMRSSYAVFCLKKKNYHPTNTQSNTDA